MIFRRFLLVSRKLLSLSDVNQGRIINKNGIILGIETSCDDTGCAIVNLKGNILGESLFSQQSLHSKLGGILPPIASQLHSNNIEIVVEEALILAGAGLRDVSAIGVTVKPGLAMSLLVGVKYAKQLASTFSKPLIPIHHMEAHALTVRISEKVEFPFVVLLISGGHCLIAVAQDVDKFLLLGKSHDDAPGEALDKIARRLKLSNLAGLSGLSGGRAIQLMAMRGSPNIFSIAEPLLRSPDCNFSFAGIKNSARSVILAEEKKYDIEGDEVLPNVADLCASVQFAVCRHLCRRLQRALTYCQRNSLIPTSSKQTLVVSGGSFQVVSGGVASNSQILRSLSAVASALDYRLVAPPPHLCTDNGVMIAWNAVERWTRALGIVPHTRLDQVDISPKAPFGLDISEDVARANIRCSWVSIRKIFSKTDTISKEENTTFCR